MAEYEIKDGIDIIPEGETEIKRSAFRASSDLKSIAIPHSVTIIGHSVLANCTSLTNVVIPNSGCTSLTSIVLS